MTKEQVEARLAILQEQRQKLLDSFEQLKANISAYNGAIEDCQYWLSQLAGEVKE